MNPALQTLMEVIAKVAVRQKVKSDFGKTWKWRGSLGDPECQRGRGLAGMSVRG